MMKKYFLFVMLMLTAAISMGDLVSYWDFEEGSGTSVADSSVNSHDGVLEANGASYPQWITGQVGDWALQFNASTTGASNANYVIADPNSVPVDANTLGLNNLGDIFTISMWVRRDSDGVNPSYSIYPRLVYTNAYDIQLAADPTWTYPIATRQTYLGWATVGDSSNRIQFADEQVAMPAIGSWYHLAITCDGMSIKQYVDGVEEASAAIPAESMVDVVSNFYIGANAGGSAFFEGAIDDVAVWAGTYLPEEEVAKLADQSETPLTVVDVEPEPGLPPNYFTLESNNAWTVSGAKLLGSPGFSTFAWGVDDIELHSNNTATEDWIKDTSLSGWPVATMVPGGHYAMWSDGVRFWFNFLNVTPENYYTGAARNVDNYGMAWIDPELSGVDPNIAKFAVYITPDIALCIPSFNWYESADLSYGKDYFKTYARVATVNGAGASMRVKSYSYEGAIDDGLEPNNLTLLGEVIWPLPDDDYDWQELKYAYPKPTTGTPRVWTEISIVGGDANTVLYIDEFNPVSDQANTSQHYATYFPGDINQDAIVNSDDLLTQAMTWLDSGSVTEPRDTGMLSNGDFYQDINRFGSNEWISVDPFEWAFAGTGDTGIQRMADRGYMNSYMLNTPAPLGGSVAAYLIDNAVLSQTTTVNAVSGQTYYAMAYVMTSSWAGWKDLATMSLEIDGSEVASFSRPMSLERWRPIYGTYTATAGDAGKPITVKFSYEDTSDPAAPGYMFVGYAYLDTVMPAEWPDGRDNLLDNGGFEDIGWMETSGVSELEYLYHALTDSDNWGAWFVDDVPAPPSWIYEVPTGFDETDEGGMFASGQMGAPIPSPGMNDVSLYASEDLILGQIIPGGLVNGTTYYLDMACGVVIEPTEWANYTATWPSPAPQFHLELWQIPSGVTNPDTIHTGITTGQPGYVKIAEAVEDSTGDIKGASDTSSPARSKWQLVGTTYTATSADTNVYVRAYGLNSVAVPHPSFAFSDVYLSTGKRLVPGGEMTFEIESGLTYDVAGPYDCYHAGLMGFDAPAGDVSGDCMVNLQDFAIMAQNWLEDWYTNITGTTPWE